MAKATLEIEMKANTQGSVNNLKAIQSNINRVADTFVTLENKGIGISKLNNTLSGFRELIDRLARDLYSSGDAASFFEAQLQVMGKALSSVNRMNGGERSGISNVLARWSTDAEQTTYAINNLTEAMELQGDVARTMAASQEKFNETLAGTEIQKEQDELLATQQALYNQLKAEADEKQRIADFNDVLYGTQAQTNLDNLLATQQQVYNQLKAEYEERERIADFWDTFKDTGLALEADEEKSLNNQIAQREKLLATQQELYNTLKDSYEQESRTQALNSLNAPSTYGTLASKNKETLIGSLLGENASVSILGFGSKLVSTIKNIMTFRAVMTFTNNIVRGFNQLMSDSTKAAAEAEQIYSKLTTVFGEYAGAMEKASELSQKIGVSATTAASALSTVGDLLQAQGASTSQSLELASEWVEKFQDIIAFKDIDMSLDEFAQSFMSGAAGNLRNFRTFGSIVKESAVNARLAADGMDQLTGSELELAKMTARAEIALEQQKNAIGATEREWDTMLSIQRRYEEATKTFKEDIGETLKPVTSGWTKLKTEIIETMNQYAAAEEAMKDPDATTTPVLSLNYGGSTEYNSKNVKGMLNQLMGLRSGEVEKIRTVINQYGATEKDLEYAFSNFTTAFTDDDFYDVAKGIAAANDEQKKLKEFTEESNKKFTALVESTDKLFENMQSIDGVNFVGSNWYKSIQEMFTNNSEIGGDADLDLTDSLTLGVTTAIDEALADISEISLSEFDKLFGDSDKGDILAKRIEAYKLLYKAIMNNAYATDEEKKKVVDAWKAETEELEKYNEEQERATKLANILKTISSGGNAIGTDYANQLNEAKFVAAWETTDLPGDYNNFFSEEHAKAYYSWQKKTNDALALAVKGSTEYQTILSSANGELRQMYSYYKYIAEESAKAAKNAQLMETANKRNETVKGYIDSTKDYYSQLEVLGMADAEATLYKLRKASDEAWEAGDSKLGAAIDANIEAFNKLQEATDELTKKESIKAAWDGIKERAIGYGGKLGSAISTFTDGEGDVWTDAITVVMDLLEQAEGFSELLEAIDSFLNPIMYWLEDVVHMLGAILVPILNVLQPLMKGIAIDLTLLSGAIDMVFGAVYDLIENLSHPFKKWNWDRTVEAWDSMNSALDKICNATVSIEKSVSKDYGTYSQLYRNGMLSKDDYYSLIGANKYSSSSTISGGTLTNNGYGQHYLSVSGCTFKLEFDGSIEDFIKKLQEYEKGNGGYAVGLS